MHSFRIYHTVSRLPVESIGEEIVLLNNSLFFKLLMCASVQRSTFTQNITRLYTINSFEIAKPTEAEAQSWVRSSNGRTYQYSHAYHACIYEYSKIVDVVLTDPDSRSKLQSDVSRFVPGTVLPGHCDLLCK